VGWWGVLLFATLLVSMVVACGAGVGQGAATQGSDEPVAMFNATVPVRANLTTGVSGGMQGETKGLDTDSATVTLVGRVPGQQPDR
jgi:hypothetical protein